MKPDDIRSPALRTLAERGFIKDATDLRGLDAQLVDDAAKACLRILAMADGSTNQAAIDATMLIRRHLPILLERYRDAVRVAEPNEIVQQATRLRQGVVDLGTLADDVRLGMLRAAEKALDVELRYIRVRISDPFLSPLAVHVGFHADSIDNPLSLQIQQGNPA